MIEQPRQPVKPKNNEAESNNERDNPSAELDFRHQLPNLKHQNITIFDL